MITRFLILSEHEVRAALDGELEMVVRPVKPQPERQNETGRWTFCVSSSDKNSQDKWSYCVIDDDGHHYTERGRERCVLSLRDPFGVPGARLVCKETWAHDAPSLAECRWRYEDIMGGLPGYGPYYQADPVHENAGLRWRSPATMPAWASRITLEVVGVRVRRCGDLTYEDAENSGVADASLGTRGMSPLTVLRDLWNRRYGRRYPWESNPWVWAAKVKRVEG